MLRTSVDTSAVAKWNVFTYVFLLGSQRCGPDKVSMPVVDDRNVI